jgi:hypothetical protein
LSNNAHKGTPGFVPQVQMDAARSFGKLVAQGIIETKDAVESLAEAAVKNGYAGDVRGMRTSLWWEVRDSAELWDRDRIRVEYAIRNAVRPLMESRADAPTILRAAYGVNDAAGKPMLRSEVISFLKQEMESFLAGRRWKGRAYGR